MRPTVALVLVLLALTLVGGVKGRRRNKNLRLRDGGVKKDRCRYSRDAEWSQCGAGVSTRQRTMLLVAGSPDHCEPTRTVTKPCRKGRKGRRLNRRNNKKARGCKYGRKSAWSKCGAGVEERSRKQMLLSGPSECPRIHVITKPCMKKNRRKKNKKNGRGKKGCQYEKRPWQPCDKESKVKKRELLLKKGDPSVCSALRTIEKPCRRRATLTGPQISKCRYKALPWSECNSRTNTQSRSLQLKSGDPALCQHTKTLTRKCRKPCKFSKGDWSECDAVTGLKSRTDRLVKGDPALCEAVRVISKMCSKDGKCKYGVGNWSDCDQESGMRTRVKTRTGGDPEKCQQEIKVMRPCVKPNGEEGCFLGNWGEYGPCQNGVMTKHRPVIAGGMECERKAVKVKPCP